MIGSAGQQIAILADTILASRHAHADLASINYADRLYQLPLGVIGVAAGTVLLPEMTRRLAAGDEFGAARGAEPLDRGTFALAAPFLVGFLMIPGELIRGAYMRGAFDARRRALGARARGLRFRAGPDGADPFGGGAFPGARRHGDADVVLLRRPGGQLALKIGLSGRWVRSASHWHRRRRLDQFRSVDPARSAAAMVRARLTADRKCRDRCFAVAGAALAAPFCFLGAEHALGRLPVLRNELDIVVAGPLVFDVYAALYVLGALAFGRSVERNCCDEREGLPGDPFVLGGAAHLRLAPGEFMSRARSSSSGPAMPACKPRPACARKARTRRSS